MDYLQAWIIITIIKRVLGWFGSELVFDRNQRMRQCFCSFLRRKRSPIFDIHVKGTDDRSLARANENDSKLDTFIYYMHVNFLPACRGAVVAERNPLSEEFKANILKYVPLLRTREFPLHDAASYLESWIAGTWKLHPLLEIGALLFCNIQTLKMFSMVAKANPT